MKRFSEKPQDITMCHWVAVQDGDECYWEGGCADDKGASKLDELTLLAEHFIGRTIVEKLSVCPTCGLEIFRDVDGWYCPSCKQ